jgi:uncharacterized protein (DUF58 family)
LISPSLHPDSISAPARRRRRFAYGLTPRAIIFLLLGLLWLYPGYFDARFAWGFPAWELLVLLLAYLDALRLPKPELITVGRSWSNAPALDSQTEIELSVLQPGGVLISCRLIDDLPMEMVALPATHRLQAFPNVAATVKYKISPTERGDFQAGSVFIRYRTGFDLVERWAVADLAQTVRIYPVLETGEEQQIFLARSRQIDLQLRQARQRGLGRDFESLREYRPGDDLRDVCWTATARRGDLITRQYQTERSQAVWLVLDCGRLMRSRVAMNLAEPEDAEALELAAVSAGVSSAGAAKKKEKPPAQGYKTHDATTLHTKLDHACSTAVALAQLALYSGDRVGLLAYGQGIQQRILPGRGASHLRQIIESLSQLKAEPSEADHLRATATLNRLQPRRSLILWITDLAETSMRPEVIDGAMQLLKRHVLLFVAMAQPEVDKIASAPPLNVEQMFRAAAAQEMVSRRERLLAQLNEHGARTLDLNPEELTASVLNQYLMIKERSLI